MLHGFLESSFIWKDFIPEFSKYGQVITIDLPGHGQSGCVSAVHTMELMAEAVFQVLHELNITRSDFIGHSMGGYVALAFLEQNPQMVRDFMLLNSTPEADSEEKKQIRERSVELVVRNKKAYIKTAISNLVTSENNERFKNELDILKKEAGDFPAEGIVAALRGMKIRKDRKLVLKGFSGQKTLVTGEEDPLIDPDHQKSLAAQCGCVFYTLNGGHLSYLESKEEFINLCISSKK